MLWEEKRLRRDYEYKITTMHSRITGLEQDFFTWWIQRTYALLAISIKKYERMRSPSSVATEDGVGLVRSTTTSNIQFPDVSRCMGGRARDLVSG